MELPSQYNAREVEARWQKTWVDDKVFAYERERDDEVYSIDTPPPTVSGSLHIGHVFSYTQTDVIARYRRMTGMNVFYPMGFDDNGLPTEILTEREKKVKADKLSREEFTRLCLETSGEFRGIYRNLWESLGFSIDWDQSYSTISEESRKISQLSFLDLLKKGRIYKAKMPSLWCPKCQTTIAQAELDAVEQDSVFYYFYFDTPEENLPIASTRPELLAACVAVFIHPENEKFKGYIGQKAKVPIFGQEVPIIADEKADPEKGTGVVMCCTFGDATDVEWYKQHKLPMRVCIDKGGKMNELAGDLEGLGLKECRQAVVDRLKEGGYLTDSKPIPAEQHVVNTHERCSTSVEYLDTEQWFVKLLDCKEDLIRQGEKINWYPKYMEVRYRNWVEGLGWDWAISRQRYFGVPIPAWTCEDCGATILPNESELPVNPISDKPSEPCRLCGSDKFIPERDVLDTWATSSVTPQICAKWESKNEDPKLRPMSMRPQAHDIIRTWAFYTIAKSYFHFGDIPWKDAVISGHVVKRDQAVQAQQVQGSKVQRKSKISKSKDSNKFTPQHLIAEHSADAIRYWTCSGRLGVDMLFDEKEIGDNKRLLTKLWNASRFVISMLENFNPEDRPEVPAYTIYDKCLLSRLGKVVERYHKAFEQNEFSSARNEVERFFWSDFCDNYIEMVKERFYKVEKRGEESRQAAEVTLYRTLYALLRLFAPFIPHITEEIFQGYFAAFEKGRSLHLKRLPRGSEFQNSEAEEKTGAKLEALVTSIRGMKSRAGYSLKQPISKIYIQGMNEEELRGIADDLLAVTTSSKIATKDFPQGLEWEQVADSDDLQISVKYDETALKVTELAVQIRPFVNQQKKTAGFKNNSQVGEVELYLGEAGEGLEGSDSAFAAALKVAGLRLVDSPDNLTPVEETGISLSFTITADD